MNWSTTLEKWVRREALWVSFFGVVAAVATLSAAAGWTPVWIAALALGVVGAAGRLAIRLRRTQLEDEREQAVLDRRVRTAVAPMSEIRATDIGVDRAAQDMLPGGEIPEYLPREADGEVQSALEAALDGSGPWLVVVRGPSKVGKSRTLYEALRRVSERGLELTLVAPTDGDSVRSLLLPDGTVRPTDGRLAVWLDDIETFVAEGVSLDTLRQWHRRTGAIFAATYGGKGSERLHGAGHGELTVLADTVLSHGAEIGLGPTSPSELARLATPLSEANRQTIETHGLAAAMMATRALERKLGTRRHAPGEGESPEGEAVVSAAVDWARCGRTDPIPRQVLESLWSTYIGAGAVADSAFERGLAWALRPVAGSVSLLGGTNGYSAYDYAVRLARERPGASPPRDEAWRAALDIGNLGQAINVGVEAHLQGRDDLALEAMRAASEATDQEIAGTANFNLGLLLEDLDDAQAAAAAYRRAIELGKSDGYVNLGALLNALGDTAGAEKAYRQAAAMGSGMGAANLGALLEKRGDLAEAEEAHRQAAELGDEVGALCLGLLLKRKGDVAGAEEAYRRAAKLGPDGFAALGGQLLDRGDRAGAEEVYREAMERGSKTGPANLGVMLKERGDLAGAEEMLRLAADRGNPFGAFELGSLLNDKGDLAGAEEAYRRAMELDMGDGAAQLGVMLKVRGDFAGAEEASRRAMELGHAGGAANYGVLLRGRGDGEGALAAFRRSAELGFDGGALNVGLVLEERKDFEGAEEAFRQAIELGNAEAAYYLGMLQEARGNLEAAEEIYRKGMELGSGKSAACFGVRLHERGDDEGAESAYRRAAELGSGWGAFNLGALLANRGDAEGAESAYRRALELGEGHAGGNLGFLLQELGDLAGAEEAYRQGIELGSGLAAYNLGFLLKDRGDEAGMEESWRTAADLGDGKGAYNLGYLLTERGDVEGARQALQIAAESSDKDAAARATENLAELPS